MMLALLFLGYFMGNFAAPFKWTLYMWHKSLGITVLVLMVLRLLWRWMHPVPEFPRLLPAWQKYAAFMMHYVLYLLLIIMPLSGWLMSSYGGHITRYFDWLNVTLPVTPHHVISEFYEEIHETLAVVIIAVLVIHIAAALKHHYINKDNVLKRMLPQRKKRRSL